MLSLSFKDNTNKANTVGIQKQGKSSAYQNFKRLESECPSIQVQDSSVHFCPLFRPWLEYRTENVRFLNQYSNHGLNTEHSTTGQLRTLQLPDCIWKPTVEWKICRVIQDCVVWSLFVKEIWQISWGVCILWRGCRGPGVLTSGPGWHCPLVWPLVLPVRRLASVRRPGWRWQLFRKSPTTIKLREVKFVQQISYLLQMVQVWVPKIWF